MNPSPCRTYMGGDIFKESQNIVSCTDLIATHLPNVEFGFSANRTGVLARDDSAVGHRFAGQNLNFQPTRELSFFGPERTHLRAGISGDHEESKVLKKNASNKCQPKLIHGARSIMARRFHAPSAEKGFHNLRSPPDFSQHKDCHRLVPPISRHPKTSSKGSRFSPDLHLLPLPN